MKLVASCAPFPYCATWPARSRNFSSRNHEGLVKSFLGSRVVRALWRKLFFPLGCRRSLVDPGMAQTGAPRLKISAGVGDEIFYMATEREKSRRETNNDDRQVIRQLCHHLLEDRLAFF